MLWPRIHISGRELENGSNFLKSQDAGNRTPGNPRTWKSLDDLTDSWLYHYPRTPRHGLGQCSTSYKSRVHRKVGCGKRRVLFALWSFISTFYMYIYYLLFLFRIRISLNPKLPRLGWTLKCSCLSFPES